MNINKFAFVLALSAGLLTACGGGGSTNSPDRPSPQLDKNSLELVFHPSGVRQNPGPAALLLGGGAGNDIQVQMIGSQSDGVRTGLTPLINVTRQASWDLTGQGNPAVAQLAATIRDAASIGDVQDILSTVRLRSDDNDVVMTVTATYENITRSGTVTVKAPVADGMPEINGLEVIPFNPAFSDEQLDTAYSLTQKLKPPFDNQDENRSNEVKFCSRNIGGGDYNPAFSDPTPTDGQADIRFENPFRTDNGTPEPVQLEIYTVARDGDCETSPAVYTKTVQLIPAQVLGVDSCVILNPESNTCGDSGLLAAGAIANCRGLNSDDVTVPAGQPLQMVARVSYGSVDKPDQVTLVRNQCSSPSSLSWTSSASSIFSVNLDSTGGDATLVSRSDYLALSPEQRSSTITASYRFETDNDPQTPAAEETDTLALNLVDAEVTSLEIVRQDNPEANAPDTLSLNILNPTIDYQARCRYQDGDSVTEAIPCVVDWSLSPSLILQASPANGNSTTVGEHPDRNGGIGAVTLTASYSDGFSNEVATRSINAQEDELVSLRLLQIADTDSGQRVVDPFSCLGRDDLVGTLGSGENYVPGSHRFFAHATFENTPSVDDPAELPDVTGFSGLRLSAIEGYSDGNGGCVTSADPSGQIPTDQLPAELDSGAAAKFIEDPEPKGTLVPDGLLRLNTVCIQTYVEIDGVDGIGEGDIKGDDSSTVLVLPAANDNLLAETNDLCEILEPVLTLGSVAGDPIPSGIVIPLVYGLAQVADPLLKNLDGPLSPALDGILSGLLSGDFSALDPNAPNLGYGLATLTSALLGSEEGALTPLVDAVDACLLNPTTGAVSGLLNALLTANPEALADIANAAPDFEACASSFGGIPGEGGDGGGDGGPTGTPLDALLGPLADAFSGAGGDGGDGPTGTPLDIILGPLVDAFSGLPTP